MLNLIYLFHWSLEKSKNWGEKRRLLKIKINFAPKMSLKRKKSAENSSRFIKKDQQAKSIIETDFRLK